MGETVPCIDIVVKIESSSGGETVPRAVVSINVVNMWRAMGELWASYGRAMGELWATIARHIFATLTLTTACGTVDAPLELSICTTMSRWGIQ